MFLEQVPRRNDSGEGAQCVCRGPDGDNSVTTKRRKDSANPADILPAMKGDTVHSSQGSSGNG